MVSTLMIVVGFAAAITSFGYGLTSERGGIGPGTVPFVAALLILVEGFMLARPSESAPSSSPVGDEEGGLAVPLAGPSTKQRDGGLMTAFVLLSMLGVVLLLTPSVGFVPMIVLFGFAAGRWIERASVFASLGLGAAAGLFIWVVFIGLLGVRLPALPQIF